MKNRQQDKKSTSNASKGVKLPLIQTKTQKANVKENQSNNSKGKLFTKGNDQKNNLKEIPQMPNISGNIPLTKNNPKNANQNQNLANSKGKTEIKNNLDNTTKEEIKIEKTNQEGSPRYTEERLSQIKKQRNQRIKQQKKEEIKEIKLYEKLINEYKNNTRKNSKKNQNEEAEDHPKVIISSKKAQTILEEGGMLDAYKYVLAQLCKNGLPSGNVFEYASYVVKNYEKKWKEKKSQKMKDKIDKYYEEKQKEMDKSLENVKENKIVNKSLEHRDELKFIQSLDKSRSGRNVVPKIKNNSPKNDRFINVGKDFIEFYNKKYNYQNESNVVTKSNEENSESVRTKKSKESNAENNNKISKSNPNDNKTKESQSNNISINKNKK